MSKGQRKGKRQPKPRPKQAAPVVTPKTPHPVRTLLKTLGGLTVAAMVIYLIAVWGSVPDQVPTTFDAQGTAVAFTSKNYLVACPILGALLWIMVALMANDNRVWRLPFKVRHEVRKQVDAIMNNTMVLLTLELEATFFMLAVSMAAAWNPGGVMLTVSLAVVVLTVAGGTLLCHSATKSVENNNTGDGPSMQAPANSLGRRF